jgi:hypothetical protein
LYSGAKAVGKEALKIGLNIITDILNKAPDQPDGVAFKNRFIQVKGNLEGKLKKVTGSGLGLKRKRMSKKPQTQGKRSKVKDISTEN